MLIEDVIRLGKPFLEGGMAPREILLQLSDAMEKGKNFSQNVILVELEGENFTVHPVMVWGEFREIVNSGRVRKEFFPDGTALGANFVVPMGGNPVRAQGWYGVPSYPIYTRTILEFAPQEEGIEHKQKALDSIKTFIIERQRKTPSLELPEGKMDKLAEAIYEQTSQLTFEKRDNPYGLMVITELKEGSPYFLSENPVAPGEQYFINIAQSRLYPGKFLIANLELVLESFWPAKIVEGAEMGEKKQGHCFFCTHKGAVISAYCKSSPWFLHTWDCPNPAMWKKKDIIDGIALCHNCYKALYYGSTVQNKLTTEIDYSLSKELFTPVSNAMGKEDARRGQAKARIYGSAYVLPILDYDLEEDTREEFIEGFQTMLDKESRSNKLDTHLRAISGFEYILPEELSRDDYRLNLTYFSGEPEKGNIYVRATIEDVLPSVAVKLEQVTREVQRYAVEVARNILTLSEQNRNRIMNTYRSLPFLLINAYGSSYLWTTLDSILHSSPIMVKRFVKNSSIRMTQLAHNLPDSINALREEVIFFMSFRYFLRLYEEQVMEKKEGITLREWRELKEILDNHPPQEIIFNNVEEVGFAAGYLTRVFSRQYYPAAGEKDYLKHRVITFGSDLTPHTIWKRALVKMREYAIRLDMKVTNDFWQRLSILLLEFEKRESEIARNRDEFMAMFWSGYNLALTPKEEQEDVGGNDDDQ